LQPLGEGSMHMPHGTSLRMGRLGYQSDAQASLAVSYNSLDGYGASLQDALTRPWPAYEAIGIRNLGGDYNQLATSLLQIENEFYGTIRPKRVIYPGERPLHALRERGVEYVEVRLMDLDPFEPVGINAQTMRFLDVFLLHCLLSDSPPDTGEEIADLAHNQHLTAARGREPGLRLRRGGREASLTDWGAELLAEFGPIAAALDAAHGGTRHAEAVRAAGVALGDPAVLPSARVLEAMKAHDDSFVGFVRARSEATRQALLALPFGEAQRTFFERMTQTSIEAQKRIEASDSMPFEIYREQYVSPARLGFKNHWAETPAEPVSQRAAL
jgi:glutamate--cysteine ligase